MSKDEENKQYFNDAQLYTLLIDPRDLVVCAGRGLGKGAIQARRMQSCFQAMPGSMGGFVAPSVKRCMTNILPSMLLHLERWGFKRDLHYTVGKRPWKKLGWRDPIFTPANWENTIAFYNGSVVNVISQDRSGTSNSMSLDYLIIDEAKFINFEQLKDETFQANRGNEMYFKNCHLHHGMTITSDMPVTKKGSWFLNYREQMDPELVEVIEGLVYQRWKTAKWIKDHGSTPTRENNLATLDRKLEALRGHCLLYKEYSSLENLALLGEEFIRRAKRDLPPLTFRTSILCQRVVIAADGFYGGLREDLNLYTAPDESRLNMDALSNGTIPDDCRNDADLDNDLPLCIALDANANINWLVAGQVGRDGRLRVLKSFFVKYERKLPELMDDFVKYYRYHRCHSVVFYYDATFVGNNYALHNNDFHSEVEQALRRAQWMVSAVYIGQPMGHLEKNALINDMLRGRGKHLVMLNRDNNPDLLVSITSAGVVNGKKDKRGEKLAETEEDRLEGRTDGSDAFDTLCIGVERFPQFQMGGIASNAYG